MAQGQQYFLLSMILLLVLSKCNSYPLFNELPVPERSMKFHSPNDVDRFANRMKQYYDTMAHLRYWRRAIDESNEDYTDRLQNILRQEYKR